MKTRRARQLLAFILLVAALMLPAAICDGDGDETEWTTPPPTMDNPTPDYSVD